MNDELPLDLNHEPADLSEAKEMLRRARAALAAQPVAQGWIPVSERLPPCDGERVFVGVNSAGYVSCFNWINPNGTCMMGSPEGMTAQMSELRFWHEFEWPPEASMQWRSIAATPPEPQR